MCWRVCAGVYVQAALCPRLCLTKCAFACFYVQFLCGQMCNTVCAAFVKFCMKVRVCVCVQEGVMVYADCVGSQQGADSEATAA